MVGSLYCVICLMVVLVWLWYLIKFVIVFSFKLCFLVNIFKFGWCVMVLLLLRIFIIIDVGFKFVKCVKLYLVFVCLVCVNILLFCVVNGKICFGWIKLVVFVFFVIVVCIVCVWFVVEILVVMFLVVLIEMVKLVVYWVLLFCIMGFKFRWW